MGDQSSLDEDVVEEDVHDNVVPGIDLRTYPLTAADDVLCIEGRPGLAAPAHCLRSLLCDHLSPLPDTEEVLLDLPDDLHRLWGTV